jgi:hypothetical protein
LCLGGSSFFVTPRLVLSIHDLGQNSWMAGPSPAKTNWGEHDHALNTRHSRESGNPASSEM